MQSVYGRTFAYLALLLGLVAAIFMQGSRGILETTEGRYAECARETLASGNALEPVLNGNHHWTKPPITYWAIGAGTALFGANPWGARAYLALAFLLSLGAVYLIESQIWKRPPSGLATLIFATSPIAIATANTVATDAILMLWEAWAFAFYWLAVRTGKRHYTTLLWVALGLAVATKGPVGLLPLTAILPAQALLRRRGDSPRGVLTIEGLVLFLGIGLSWYVYVVAKHPEVFQQWIGVEIVGRLQYDAHDRLSSESIKIFTSYLPIMLLGTGPWLVWLLWLRRSNVRVPVFRALLRDPGFAAEHIFLALAVVVQFVLFSFSTSRMPLYLAPLFVPMAIAVGRGLDLLLESGRITGRAVFSVAVATALIMSVAKGFSASQGTWKNMTDIAAELQALPEIRDGAPLTALFRAPLNGLQFHLGRRIPTIYFKIDDPELLKKKPDGSMKIPDIQGVANTDQLPRSAEGLPSVPAGSLVLVRSKDLEEFGPYFGSFGLDIVTKSKHWTLLRVKDAINIASMAEDRSAEDDN